MKKLAMIAATLLIAFTSAEAAKREKKPEAEAPFFAVAANGDADKVLATLPAPGEDGVMLRAIHASGLTAGLGSNPVGLDRGAGEGGRIIAFRKVGKKVVIEQENWNYRASADNALEKKSVANSFARSFLWAGDIAETTKSGGVVVDLTGFLTTDLFDVRGALKNAGQGDYSIAADRSFPDYSSALTFPDNVEIDAFVTFIANTAGSEVTATAADGRMFTLTMHHSFVRLPPEGFKTRAFDPRMSGIDVPFYDFSAPLGAPIVKAYARRFRLERVDPSASSGPVKKPIVFYVDSGAPEPVRAALIEGASWWADAFAAAGFENAFRVEVLPEGAQPMDVRYNVIQWVHRQTRGWSYGGGVSDPRTGEMIKAYVILGSQRVRQDRMIFEGLAGAQKTGTGAADDPVEMSLARIRQLAAHEVGHPLGFAHNFAASVSDRASVMDYPAPYVKPVNGALDFSEVYSEGMGEWDLAAARWLYSEYSHGADERAALDKIIRDAYAKGLKFVDDPQGRPVSAANPYGSVWDNGSDPVAALKETMEVRRIALANFGERSLQDGQPTADLKAILVPVYLYHRYQVDAAAKLVGGYDFRYGVKGDAAPGTPAPAARQREALAALVATLDAPALDLPDATLNQLGLALASFGPGAAAPELFPSNTGAMFDLASAADAAGAMTLSALLNGERIARVLETERRNPGALSYEQILAAIEGRVFAPAASARQNDIARTLQTRFVSTLIDGAAGKDLKAARTDAYLRSLRGRLAGSGQAHRIWLAGKIDAHLSRPAPEQSPAAPAAKVPPGSPIGAMEDCWFCDLN